MKIGAHVSAAGGIFNAPANAAKIGCEVFQVFTRSPQGGPAPKLTEEIVGQFKAETKKHRLGDFAIHTPYYINFASTTPRIRYGSIGIVREELERGTLLGAKYVITHLGSTKDAGKALGFHKTWRAIQRILDGYKGTTELLMELSAGAGDLVGGTFEELASLIKHIESKTADRGKVNVCLDTCHLFAAGYDVRTKTALAETIRRFDQTVGLKRLKYFHGNDSVGGLGEHKDRHQHIGQGQIGMEGFRALVNHPKLKYLDLVVETPWDGSFAEDVKVLKKLRR
ncbi:MAG: deoxyribonuclease IV [Candidatus Kerfeldbacteria bacterium]|nr:deoxyribonuclease IV [Candidatus Kerfeldbacteria bacterium]